MDDNLGLVICMYSIRIANERSRAVGRRDGISSGARLLTPLLRSISDPASTFLLGEREKFDPANLTDAYEGTAVADERPHLPSTKAECASLHAVEILTLDC